MEYSVVNSGAATPVFEGASVVLDVSQCRGLHKYTARNTLDCDQSNYSSRIVFSHIPIEFRPARNSAIRSVDPGNPTLKPNMK